MPYFNNMPDGMNNWDRLFAGPFMEWANLHFCSASEGNNDYMSFVAVADPVDSHLHRVIRRDDALECGSYEQIKDHAFALVNTDNRTITIDAPNAYAVIREECRVEDQGPSTKELGVALGYWVTIAMGGDDFTGNLCDLRQLLNMRASFEYVGTENFKNWHLRYYGQLMGMDPFPIGTTNEEMFVKLRAQVGLSEFDPSTIKLSEQTALSSDGSDGWFRIRMSDHNVEFFTFGAENEREICLTPEHNAFEVIVDYDSTLCASAIRSVHAINSKAARS